MKTIKSVCVFCGAQDDIEQKYKDHAFEIGRQLALRNITLIYGGARDGVMHSIAHGATSKGGEVIAIYPVFFKYKQYFEHEITRVIDVNSLAERKNLMIEMADLFLTLPGGFGTLDELFEVLTTYTLHPNFQKPTLIYNQDNYWQSLKETMNNIKNLGFLRQISHEYTYKFYDTHEEIFATIDRIQQGGLL